jgi:hypothetical protein
MMSAACNSEAAISCATPVDTVVALSPDRARQIDDRVPAATAA